MKQTLEEAARQYCKKNFPYSEHLHLTMSTAFEAGAEWYKERSIEVFSSILENWVHGGDADCIIAEFEEKLNQKL